MEEKTGKTYSDVVEAIENLKSDMPNLTSKDAEQKIEKIEKTLGDLTEQLKEKLLISSSQKLKKSLSRIEAFEPPLKSHFLLSADF